MEDFQKKFNLKKFSNKPLAKKVEKPWGWEIIWTAQDAPYVGKLIFIKKKKRLSLQYHDKKHETQLLLTGRVIRISDDKKGNLVKVEMVRNKGYKIVPGQRHRLRALSDSVIVETSTKEVGTTFRLEDDYKRGDETEKLRGLSNRGWNIKT